MPTNARPSGQGASKYFYVFLLSPNAILCSLEHRMQPSLASRRLLASHGMRTTEPISTFKLRALGLNLLRYATWICHSQHCTDFDTEGCRGEAFQEKGFSGYNQMIPLMPNHVRGTHAFRPSDQTFGAITNQPTASNSNMPPSAPRGDIGEDDAAINSDDNEQVAPLSLPPRPPFLLVLPLSTPLHPTVKAQTFCTW